MKKYYEKPEILIEVLRIQDILTTSDFEIGDNDIDFDDLGDD